VQLLAFSADRPLLRGAEGVSLGQELRRASVDHESQYGAIIAPFSKQQEAAVARGSVLWPCAQTASRANVIDCRRLFFFY
jgi:hypothetical protein